MGVLLELPEALRSELKQPLGAIYTDPEGLLAAAGEPVVAVGDVVTYHLLEAGYRPTVAVVDGLTEREPIDGAVADALDGPRFEDADEGEDAGFDRVEQVENPAATLTAELLSALTDAVGEPGATLLVVDGEEDLATLPAVLAVPEGASVVYGQPDEGMVLVVADTPSRWRVRSLLDRMEGDHDAVRSALGIEDEP